MSPSPEQIEYAELLLRRADDHVRVCRVLKDDVAVTDEIIGLHSHAAANKALRVALVLAGVELPITDDLDLLVQLGCASGADAPTSVSGAGWLTPWAFDSRYDQPDTLDRSAALSAAESAVGWAEALLSDAAASEPQGSIQGSVLSKTDPAEPDPTPAATGNSTLLDPPWATS